LTSAGTPPHINTVLCPHYILQLTTDRPSGRGHPHAPPAGKRANPRCSRRGRHFPLFCANPGSKIPLPASAHRRASPPSRSHG
jgi:hypothetical protein